MSNSGTAATRLTEYSDSVADSLDADVLLFNGPMNESESHNLLNDLHILQGRENVFLILITRGGDAHFAFRIARCLQRKYKHFTICISGQCKSAGALLTIGAHEIVMTDEGELGPLDVQIRKPDELWETSSGLTDLQALDTLRHEAFKAFGQNLFTLKVTSGITLRTCLEVATQLTVGLFNPIYSQIDPMRLGENSRAMRIGEAYGERLNEIGGNLQPVALAELLAKYPSHSFVIDRRETEKLFKKVREPTQQESGLIESLDVQAWHPNDTPLIKLLSSPSSSEQTNQEGEDGEQITPDPGGATEETGESTDGKRAAVSAVEEKL